VVSDIPADIVMDSFPGPLGQVLTDLINNALLHAFDGTPHGTVSIRAVVEGSRPRRNCWSRIDGCGIAQAHLARVFDPFFTTKLGQGGSGLGLNIVYNLVTKTLGGTIHVASSPGEGRDLQHEPAAQSPGDHIGYRLMTNHRLPAGLGKMLCMQTPSRFSG